MIKTIQDRKYSQYVLNAHGMAPRSHKLEIEKTMDGHRYISSQIETYQSTVPEGVILIKVTPPNHILGYDGSSQVVKQTMVRLHEIGLEFLFKEISNNILGTINSSYCEEDLSQSYMAQLIANLQMYYPNDCYFNQEIVFESGLIDDIFDLNQESIEPFQQLHTKLGNQSTPLYTSKIKLDSSQYRRDCNFPKCMLTAYNYATYSLSSIINKVKEDTPNDTLRIVYCFTCNPSPDKSLANNQLVSQLRQNLYEKAQERANQFKYLLSTQILTRERRLSQLYDIESQETGVPVSVDLISPFDKD